MTIKLFDLPGAEPDPRFGPYCWRSKLALARKGLALEAIPWLCRKGREAIAMSGQGRVPVLLALQECSEPLQRSRLPRSRRAPAIFLSDPRDLTA
jgi:hypothetical protein